MDGDFEGKGKLSPMKFCIVECNGADLGTCADAIGHLGYAISSLGYSTILYLWQADTLSGYVGKIIQYLICHCAVFMHNNCVS